MADNFTVACLVGSLRRESFTRKVAHTLTTVAPASLAVRIEEIGGLPLYNPDLEAATPPAEWAGFRDRIRGVDAVLFATPEYNRSIPGALKNAIDIGSRPRETSAFRGKPAAVMSVSPGALGGFGAHHHLRQTLVFLDMPAMQQPEAYVGGVGKLFSPDGELINDGTRDFLTQFMSAFAEWIAHHVRR